MNRGQQLFRFVAAYLHDFPIAKFELDDFEAANFVGDSASNPAASAAVRANDIGALNFVHHHHLTNQTDANPDLDIVATDMNGHRIENRNAGEQQAGGDQRTDRIGWIASAHQPDC